jgi:putative ABC transport system permease protein
MSWLSRVLNVVRRGRLNRELDEEIEFHLAARTEELISGGMTPDQAREQARRQFGNALVLRESSRDIKLFPRLESILQDVVFGLRLCRKNATLTAAAVMSLSLAIGACTAAFSLIDALILRPLPVNDPERLVYAVSREPTDPEDDASFNYPVFERMRDASRAQVQLFGMSYQSRRDAVFDDSNGQPEKVYAQWISGAAFPILGVKPALGRLLTESDDLKPGQHPVAVLSYDFWSRRFGRNPSVLGRSVTIREKQLQIVGVAEKGFTGAEPGIVTELWAPNMMWDDEAIVTAGWSWFRIWGRLRPGVTSDQARAPLQAVFTDFQRERSAGFRADEPRDRIERFINTPLYLRSATNGPSGLRQSFERPLWVLGIIAGLVLLIACSNVASLLIARAAARDREMALRLSIGAGRGRLIQQMLIESAILSVASCLAGALFAIQAAPLIVDMLSTSQRIVRFDLRLDLPVLGFLTTAGSVTTLLFGLAPALRASAVSPNDALKSGSGRQTTRIGLFRPLVAAQTAFSFLVLFVAGLFLASFTKLVRTDLGFDRNNLVVIDVEARELRQDGPKASSMWRQLLGRISKASGVQAVSLSGWGLFEGSTSTQSVRIPGRPVDAFEPHYLPVSPRFLETMRIRLVGGRDFEWRDWQPDSPSAVIVNESFVRRYFPGESALGKRFFIVEKGTLVAHDIVGIAADAKYSSVRDAAPPTVYGPMGPASWASVQVRTHLEPGPLIALLRNELPRVHPAFRMTGVTLQSTLVDNTLVRERALALLSGFFSIVAIVLVAVGLYGVLSYGVVQRTREIGIRVALGARPLAVVRLAISETGLVTLVGLGLGLACGIVASGFITALLHEVKPSDIWSIAAPLTCLLFVCSLSALLPALRAARVDPATALRYE